MSSTVIHSQPGHPVSDFGGVRAEFEHLRSGCGLFDLSARAKVALTGGDRVRWLNGMVTNNVRDLAAGHGVYAFLLNPQGHILGDLFAYHREDSLLVDTDQSQVENMLLIFDRYIIMDDVIVANLSDRLTAVGVAGPQAKATLHGAGFDCSGIERLQLKDAAWRGKTITIARGDNPAVDWYEIWLAPGEVAELRSALTAAGAHPVGSPAMELLRIASGVPQYGVDVRERDLPQETEQARALNFNKGCYVGQEIVERIRSRGAVHRKFSGFVTEGTPPQPGTKIEADGKEIGEITSSAVLPVPSGERSVALGYIRREKATAGKVLHAGGVPLQVAALPFTDIFPLQDNPA